MASPASVKAWKGDLKKQLVLDRFAARAREQILWIGRIGQGARGIVFVIMGGYAVAAGWHTNPQEAKGLGEALRVIERAPYGPYLLAAVAAGLLAYGLFQFVEARYRRIAADVTEGSDTSQSCGSLRYAAAEPKDRVAGGLRSRFRLSAVPPRNEAGSILAPFTSPPGPIALGGRVGFDVADADVPAADAQLAGDPRHSPVRTIFGWPLGSLTTSTSVHAIPPRQPVPSTLSTASLAANRPARCSKYRFGLARSTPARPA